MPSQAPLQPLWLSTQATEAPVRFKREGGREELLRFPRVGLERVSHHLGRHRGVEEQRKGEGAGADRGKQHEKRLEEARVREGRGEEQEHLEKKHQGEPQRGKESAVAAAFQSG